MEDQFTENLQTLIGNFLFQIGEQGEKWWFILGIFLMGLLIYLTATKLVYQEIIDSTKINKFSRYVNSSAFFSYIIALTILFFRFPGFSRLELNPDENEWIAGALTLLIDSRFWLSVDGYTGGPLLIYPLTLVHYLGGDINYGTVKLIGVCIWVVSTCFIYFSFINFFQDAIARVIVLPLIACVSTLYYWDYVAYNSEHVPILLMSLSFFLYSKSVLSSGRKKASLIALISFTLGCIPYAKLQAVPIGVAMAVYILFHSTKKEIVYAVLGGILPSILVLMYLLIIDIWDDFWQSYILNNISYAKTGLGERKLTILEKISLFKEIALVSADTSIYFTLQLVQTALSTALLFIYRKFITNNEYKLITLAFTLAIISIYCVIQPGNDFRHYLLLTIVPFTLLSGTITGLVLIKYFQIKKPNYLFLILILGLIIINSVYLPLTKSNPAFKEAFTNTFYGKMKSKVAEKILEYAEPGERMAIWGWADKYYVETQMAQGTREPHPYHHIIPNNRQEYYLNRYKDDLENNKPAIFLEAVGPNQFYFQDSLTQGYKNFPQIKAVISKNYKFIATVDGVNIYAARDRKSKVNLKEYITKINTLPQEQLDIQYNIENVIPDSTILTVSGWAFIKNQSSEFNTIRLVLKSDSNTYMIKTKSFFRPDVTAHFKNLNLDRSGFLAPILKSELHNGNYKLGILIKDEKNKFEILSFTDRVIMINNLSSIK